MAAKRESHNTSPEIKDMEVRYGMQLAYHLGYVRVSMECDAPNVVNVIKSTSGLSDLLGL